MIVTSRSQSGRIRLLAVLPDREKATVVDFLRSTPQRLKETIECGCGDMYEGYTEAIREELPDVRRVIDRFHVAETYRDGMENLRKQEHARLKKEPPAEDYKLLKWWNEILNYFVARQSSGFVEGLNNKIKVIKRRCYGITNSTHLFQ